MINAFRHLTPSFIAYRGLKAGWKCWWRRDGRIIFSSQNQIESWPGFLCPISLESIRFRVMRSSKCITTPDVTHLSFWEQPLVMERHVLHYEYKWADLSFSRNNWLFYIYIGMIIAWYRHAQQVCKALALKLDYRQWRIQRSPPAPYFTTKLRPEGPKNIFWRPHPSSPFLKVWMTGLPLLWSSGSSTGPYSMS